MFNNLTVQVGAHTLYGDNPDLLIVKEWIVTIEGKGQFYVTNKDMRFYECVDESGETVLSSDSLDGILTHLASEGGVSPVFLGQIEKLLQAEISIVDRSTTIAVCEYLNDEGISIEDLSNDESGMKILNHLYAFNRSLQRSKVTA